MRSEICKIDISSLLCCVAAVCQVGEPTPGATPLPPTASVVAGRTGVGDAVALRTEERCWPPPRTDVVGDERNGLGVDGLDLRWTCANSLSHEMAPGCWSHCTSQPSPSRRAVEVNSRITGPGFAPMAP